MEEKIKELALVIQKTKAESHVFHKSKGVAVIWNKFNELFPDELNEAIKKVYSKHNYEK